MDQAVAPGGAVMTPVVAGLLAAASIASLFAAVAARVDPAVVALIPARAAVPGRGALRRAVRDRPVVVKALSAACVFCVVAIPSPSLAPLGVIAAAGAFVVPNLVRGRAARDRTRKADAEVPLFLDMLAASSSAGLAASAAIRRAAAGLRGPLADELSDASAAVDVGGRWRDELRSIAERLRLPDLRAAVTAIVRTETLGSSLAEAVRDQVEEVRETRRARAEERARTAPVKMLFPLVFMILPAFLLLAVAPVLIATLRSL
jgi:tight adherence protein C